MDTLIQLQYRNHEHQWIYETVAIGPFTGQTYRCAICGQVR